MLGVPNATRLARGLPPPPRSPVARDLAVAWTADEGAFYSESTRLFLVPS